MRVRILELLRDGEQAVGSLQAALGIDSSGTSQHLGALRRLGVLESRRDGTSVYYRVKDPRTFQLLEVARQILTSRYEDAQVTARGARGVVGYGCRQAAARLAVSRPVSSSG